MRRARKVISDTSRIQAAITQKHSTLTDGLLASVLAYLGEGLLVVVFELQGVDIELVLVGGERVVVLGLFREKLLDLHRHPLAAVLKGLDWDVGGSHRVLTKEHTSYGTKAP